MLDVATPTPSGTTKQTQERPMEILPSFTLTDIETTGARIRLRHAGSGPGLLLLHGNPLTHVAWHKIAPHLTDRFHVVAADLRGYGDSSAPPEEADSANYSFRAMARDQVEVMRALGHDRFYVAGHDRGARTTHRMCLDHPDTIIKAAILDIVPTLDMWAAMDKDAAISGWHWPFMAQPAPFPETMLAAVDPDWFMRKKLLKLTADLNHIPPEIWAEYVRCFNEKTIKGSCADYRAAATIDCDLDTADLHRELAIPLLILWGAHSSVGKRFKDPLALWRQRAFDVRGEALPCGHYVNEETPEQVLDWFLRFFAP
jgi:haloacetate dehalogenase